MEIEHFSHHHTLFLSDEKEGCDIPCNVCSEPVMGLVYCCKQCVFVLHKWCAEIPHEIHDQTHPHVLTLVPNGPSSSSFSNNFSCNRCLEESSCFRFSCIDCSYNIHVECASFVTNHQVTFLVRGKSLEFSHIRVMPLSDRSFTCVACGFPGNTSWFECKGETIKLHVQCANLPNTAKHPTHRHQLILSANFIEDELDGEEFYCDACEEQRDPKDWIYHCSKDCCSFATHISCANSPLGRLDQFVKKNPLYESAKHRPIDPQQQEIDLSLTETFERMLFALEIMEKRNKDRKQIEDSSIIELDLQYIGHNHPLILYDESFIEAATCEVCFTGTYGKTYICKDCKYYLHKWCSKLPEQIQHPIHQEHSLTLTKSHYTWNCELCKSSESFHMGYHCNECNVSLHVLCASLPQNLLRHDIHKHRLTPVCLAVDRKLHQFSDSIFPKKYSQELPVCNICAFPCDQLSLECDECNFYVHIQCFLLPITGKHVTHRHDLVLGLPPDWDMDSEEFYCDACELERNSRSWVYFCAECAQEKYVYAAHIDCVHSPKLILS
ncbi:uncharacterized protein LOC124911438 [Impatiens glandulifera]|uniref:uncharacterized protein LOC124911438 n=1 Tax=Impatiens glandulifera TaxID=253017 RepID=UPI001FB11257|nr:uncharacterized protein LOC124911438 [Impatiens glandulifera]